MTLDEYQHAATRTMNASLSRDDMLLDAAAGLAEEAGEVLALIRKARFQGKPYERERLVAELGDALWCLSVAADRAGITLGEVAAANLEKLKTRHPEGFSPIPGTRHSG